MNVRRRSEVISLTYAPESACPDALLTTPCTLPANSAARIAWTLTSNAAAAAAARIRLRWLNIVFLLPLAGIELLGLSTPHSLQSKSNLGPFARQLCEAT